MLKCYFNMITFQNQKRPTINKYSLKCINLCFITILYILFSENSYCQKLDTITYFSSKKMESKGITVNGLKEGKWVWYYETGQIRAVGSYKSDKEVGEWKWFHTNGIIWATGSYVGYKASHLHGRLWVRFPPRKTMRSIGSPVV